MENDEIGTFIVCESIENSFHVAVLSSSRDWNAFWSNIDFYSAEKENIFPLQMLRVMRVNSRVSLVVFAFVITFSDES